ncbi:MAG TPA: PAS domain-containing protein, partial [Nitrospira sp.]|nr:PAS domain-containing protein [Nitrospira sp.]
KVTLLNPAAEGLTGWSQPDALGKAIQDVMVVLDAQRRTPLVNPGLAALQNIRREDSGKRPFLLMSRQGVEHVIHESATVIQDEQGVPSGAVLVFRLATT